MILRILLKNIALKKGRNNIIYSNTRDRVKGCQHRVITEASREMRSL
jgi:hypothetical protein